MGSKLHEVKADMAHIPKLVKVSAKPSPIEIDLKRTSVITVDMQNGFCSKGGMFDLLGRLNLTKMSKCIKVDKLVIDTARAAGLKIIYLQGGPKPGFWDSGGQETPNYWKQNTVLTAREHPEWGEALIVEGTWGFQIVDELKPQLGDIKVHKPRYGGFTHTNLDAILKTYNIKYLVFIGEATNVCVAATIIEAFHRDYFCILIEDGITTSAADYIQDGFIRTLIRSFGWGTTSSDFIQAIKMSS